MSRERKESENNGESMSRAEFEARLTEFFSQHKQSKLRLVPKIVEEFKGQENAVLEHLYNKYVLGIVSEKPKKKHSKKAEHVSHEESTAEVQEKPKSKKKLFLIIGIAVAVIALGLTGFLLKDKLLGKKEAAKTEEATPAQSPASEQPKEEATPATNTQTDTLAAAPDSTAVTDSIPANTDSVPAE